jgi:IS30 family transposase
VQAQHIGDLAAPVLRHYLPKGTDLSGLTQEELDAIA